MSDRMRLDKALSQRGIGTRSVVRKLIRSGRVSVDGAVCKQSAQWVTKDSELRVDDVLVRALPTVIVWHKPWGVVSTMRDPHGRHDLADVLPPEYREHFHPVGRLDAETTGLLLFSRVGGLTQWMLHPKRALKRRYEARVEGEPGPELIERLSAGVETSIGTFSADVEAVESDLVRLGVREGKHRMVRRILANSGHPVVHLHRISYGPFELRDLEEGLTREASPEELGWLEAHGAPLSDS